MKQKLKNSFYLFLRSPLTDPLKRLVERINHHILAEQKESLSRMDESVFGEKIVLTGPFKGMQYPSLFAHGSALYPKLIGSYEMELYPVFKRLLPKNYREIIDIGAAEGYYAVGLARVSTATIYAYEIDAASRTFCENMAEINGVKDRVVVKTKCTPEALANFPFTNGLVICDCEGCEDTLFTPGVLKNFTYCDAIVELHEFIIPHIRKKLVDMFTDTLSQTHHISVIKTEIRSRKAFRNILVNLDSHARHVTQDEFRPGPMEWLVVERI